MNTYAVMKRLCRITDEVYAATLAYFSEFKTEIGVARFINKQFRLRGVKPAFRTIVANNAAEIHHLASKRKLRRGFVIIDIGARDKGMCSDMSRTIFIGKPNTNERKLYELVMNCQEKCCRMVKQGIGGDRLDKHARKLLGRHAKYFLHSLGHGLGRKIHQGPRISSKNPGIVKIGDFITIEPGIYIKGRPSLGIRIEDTLHVGKKVEILTKSPKKLICRKYTTSLID